MNRSAAKIQRAYLLLLLCTTLATSLIWGINTLLLLDAGLSNAEAFGANAAFTAGFVLFEIPTGVVADTRGRRFSYLLGTCTLAAATVLYVVLWHVRAPFFAWLLASLFLGLGYTFFSGAVQAWLVDALAATGYFRDGGVLETVLARGLIVEGAAMFCGAVGGGVLAQATNLGVPFLVRAGLLVVTFVLAFRVMHDLGFERDTSARPFAAVREVLRASMRHGFANRPVRWVMLAAPFVEGVTFYGFYAMQPYLLELYGRGDAYAVAGLGAGILSLTQVAGGLLVPRVRRLFRSRTTMLLTGTALGSVVLALIAAFPRFEFVLVLLVAWGLLFDLLTPVRQAYLNDLIPSKQRATVLSFDSLLAASGGVVVQPMLGRAADAWSYPASYAAGAAIQLFALPFLLLARRERAPADAIAHRA